MAFSRGVLLALTVTAVAALCPPSGQRNLPSNAPNWIVDRINTYRRQIPLESIVWDNTYADLASDLYGANCQPNYYTKNVTDCGNQLRGVMRQYQWPNMDVSNQAGAEAIVDAWWNTSPWVTAAEDADEQAHYYISVFNRQVNAIGCSQPPASCNAVDNKVLYCVTSRYVTNL